MARAALAKDITGGLVEAERNKLVFFEEGIYNFDLEDLLRDSTESRMRIATGVARGVTCLQVLGKVVHGNRKSSNILLRGADVESAAMSFHRLHRELSSSTSQAYIFFVAAVASAAVVSATIVCLRRVCRCCEFRPVIQAQQGQPFGHAIPPHMGMPVQGQQLQYSQSMQQLTPRPMQPGHPAPSSQAIPMPYVQTNRPLTSIPPHSQQSGPPLSNHMPGMAVSGAAPHSSYTFTPSYGQQQDNASALAQYQHPPQMLAPPAGQPWPSSAPQSFAAVTSVQPAGVQSSGTTSTDAVTNATNQQSLSDWQEHTSADGRRYYYNKRTRQSSWDKPLELMSPIERADASTVWKEFTSSEGRKYYYNKVTQQSTWSIPEELKMAREQAQKAVNQGMQSETTDTSNAIVSSTPTSTAANAASSNSTLTSNGLASSPSSVTPIAATDSQQLVSGLSGTSVSHSAVTSSTTGAEPSTVVTSAAPTIVSGSSGLAENSPQQSKMPPLVENQASQDFASVDGSSLQDIEEAKRVLPVVGKNNVIPTEEKTNEDETLVYANKLEAKNAFKALLESVNVQSDWTWEQAMREIINDKRYNALKTLGERKQAFNEVRNRLHRANCMQYVEGYLGQRKKLEAEERRMKQKRAREEFTKMLEECKELTSSMRWSKAMSMFENDDRFNAVERPRDREDLFESYMVELERKEKENAAEEHRRNIAEYRKFLESCDYVKVNSHWRKIQDRLEDDDRYLRLEKIDRLLVFQDRIRRGERKNRDAFRKLLEEHVAAGILTAKTQWREYCLKVRDLPQYQAVASNTSGSTPKDLFEDVAEELEKQYHEDKTLIKDAVKSGKIIVVATSVFEDFKDAVLEEAECQTISEINLKLIFDELLERAKEKEEKEAKKRQRLADDFTNMLYTIKRDGKNFAQRFSYIVLPYRSIGDETYGKEVFEEYITYLKEKAKEKERKREEEKAKKEKEREEKEKRKEKEKKEKDREREKEKSKERHRKDETDSDNQDITDSHGYKEEKKKEKDKERKHRKRHQSSMEDVDSEKEEKEESKKSRRHGSERKRSRKHANSPESDNESRHRRHKREHWDGSRKIGGLEELEDGELGDDAEN
ncbi:hypothetical protein Fmac_031739 [Flemingia macrophylla]|uniref:Pre-mRNA-processing protein 40A n=1 Tax=Flemingia macrophylla TaxID=520843 RepID=A0ABD1L2W4_9FABA